MRSIIITIVFLCCAVLGCADIKSIDPQIGETWHVHFGYRVHPAKVVAIGNGYYACETTDGMHPKMAFTRDAFISKIETQTAGTSCNH